MAPTWLPLTSEGYTVGDYISTSFTNSVTVPAFAVATGPANTAYHEAMYTTAPLSLINGAGLGGPLPAESAATLSGTPDHPRRLMPEGRRRRGPAPVAEATGAGERYGGGAGTAGTYCGSA